jgi:predicted transcriptional regulator
LQAIDRVLEILATDKAWHSVDEIAERANLLRQETTEIIRFLAMNEFIFLDERGKKAKIKEKIDKFLVQIQKEEEQSAPQ